MTYNRAEIMKAAWVEAKDIFKRLGYARHQMRGLLRTSMLRAWAKAKAAAALAARSVQSLRDEIVWMENADRLGRDGLDRLAQLRNALANAQRRETSTLGL